MNKAKKGGVMMDFAAKCRIVRAAKAWGQKALAKAIGVDWTTISAWENGKRGPHYAAVQKIEKLFKEVQEEIIK